MDQIKIGNFIKELRKEKNLTQEELAEKFGVARRTVSRWETGSNMPDLDILIEMADFYDVDLREILDGERKSEKMEKDLKETVLKVAEYSNEEKRKSTRMILVFFVVGIVALLCNLIMEYMGLVMTPFIGFVKGFSIGIALGVMILGILYATGTMTKVCAFKKRMLGKE